MIVTTIGFKSDFDNRIGQKRLAIYFDSIFLTIYVLINEREDV